MSTQIREYELLGQTVEYTVPDETRKGVVQKIVEAGPGPDGQTHYLALIHRSGMWGIVPDVRMCCHLTLSDQRGSILDDRRIRR